MTVRSRLRYLLLFLSFLLLVNIVTVEAGRDESRVTVSNLTEHYLHVVVEGVPFLYVAPLRSVTYVTGATPQVHVEVFYSPGQQHTGRFEGMIEVPYVGSTTGCTCESGDLSGNCTHSPAVGGSALVEIVPELLQGGEAGP